MFMVAQSILLNQSAVQNKILYVASSFGKFEKISTLGKNPLYGIIVYSFLAAFPEACF